MPGTKKKRHPSLKPVPAREPAGAGQVRLLMIPVILGGTAVLYFLLRDPSHSPPQPPVRRTEISQSPADIVGWTERGLAVSRLFHQVYTPC
jgi:hypothetical protein